MSNRLNKEIQNRTVLVLVLSVALLTTSAALGQEGPDSNRVSIQELESNLHRWDVIRTDSAVQSFERGKEFAIQGRLDAAALEMRKGLKKRQPIAQFNLGVLDFEQGRYGAAYSHFNAAYRLKPDSVCREYLKNARRLYRTKEGRK